MKIANKIFMPKSQPFADSKMPQFDWRDLAIIFALVAIAGIASYHGFLLTRSVEQSDNLWFGGDSALVFTQLTHPESDVYKRVRHPWFPILAPALVSLAELTGLDSYAALGLVTAGIASLWIGMMFVLLRLMGCRQLDSTIFSILALTSASAIFWFVVPECYPLSSLSLLFGLLFAAIVQYRKLSALWYAIATTITLSMSVTNGFVGFLITILNWSWKQSLKIIAGALFLTVLPLGIYRLIRPFIFTQAVTTPTVAPSGSETAASVASQSGGVLGFLKQIIVADAWFMWHPQDTIGSFFFHTTIAPAFKLSQQENGVTGIVTQGSTPGSASMWGLVSVFLWIALLSLGVWGFFSVRWFPQLKIVLGLTLLEQLFFHVAFGDETFLYSLHFVPLLIMLAALSTLTRVRWFAIALSCSLIVCMAINNFQQFDRALAEFPKYLP
jgi:hypothetical protein